MRSGTLRLFTVSLAAALITPLASAADVTVGGRNSQVWVPSRRWVAPIVPPVKASPANPRVIAPDGRRIVDHGRPLVVVVDDVSAFGQPVVPGAPPLVIQVEGDVTIVPQDDGSLRLEFDEEE